MRPISIIGFAAATACATLVASTAAQAGGMRGGYAGGHMGGGMRAAHVGHFGGYHAARPAFG